MKTRPFNLTDAKAGKPVQTVGGRKARIVCEDVKGTPYPMLVLLEVGDREDLYEYTLDGIYDVEAGGQEEMDLVMIPETKSVFVNIYLTTDDKLILSNEYDTIAEAKDNIVKSSNIHLETREIIVEI